MMNTKLAAQPMLLAIGEPSATCKLCGRELGPMRRCRICGKGEWPRPGTPAWHRWSRGLRKTIQARLDDLGLGSLAMATVYAALFDDGEVPALAAPLVADITSMPCSLKRYRRLESRAVCHALIYDEMRRRGKSHGLAERIADELADETADIAEELRRQGAAASDRLRIDDAPLRLRISAFDLSAAQSDEQDEEDSGAKAPKLRRIA